LIIGNKFCDMNSNFHLDESQKSFSIVMLNRQGDIIYTDKEARKNYVSSPIKIVSNERIIVNFSSIQACYIGILAGTRSKRRVKKIATHAQCIYLTLVK
jgi:hypothetical protein